VPDEQIASLQTVLSKSDQAEDYPYLRVGDKVRVKHGLLKGATGFLSQAVNGQRRLVVSVDAAYCSVSVEINEADVERA
jgi:transcription antitermination factor NusG